jgi:hypothetical protein
MNVMGSTAAPDPGAQTPRWISAPMRIIGDYAFVPLEVHRRFGKRKWAKIDLHNIERVERLWWRPEAGGRTFYAVAKSGKTLPHHHMKMHAFIVRAEHGERWDHINGDGLDNTEANLRLCSQAENARNRRKTNASWVTSRFKGVSITAAGRWCAQITTDGVRTHLGLFTTEAEAAQAYDAAAIERHGAFAKTNLDLGLYEHQAPIVEPSTGHRMARPVRRLPFVEPVLDSAERLLAEHQAERERRLRRA